MQYSQEHLKTMVYAKFGGQTECIMGNWKIENNFTSIRSLCSSAAAVHLAFPRLELTGMLMQGVLLKYDWCKCEMLIQTTRTLKQ